MTSPDHGFPPLSIALQITEAEMVKALGHPHRLRIAQMLRTGPRPVAELIEAIGTAPSTMSTYLGALRRAGLVSTYRVDGTVMYELAERSVHVLIQAIRVCLTDVTRRSSLVTDALDSPDDHAGEHRAPRREPPDPDQDVDEGTGHRP